MARAPFPLESEDHDEDAVDVLKDIRSILRFWHRLAIAVIIIVVYVAYRRLS